MSLLGNVSATGAVSALRRFPPGQYDDPHVMAIGDGEDGVEHLEAGRAGQVGIGRKWVAREWGWHRRGLDRFARDGDADEIEAEVVDLLDERFERAQVEAVGNAPPCL